MTTISKYKNGNTEVEIFSDGSKVRSWPDDEEPRPVFPESLDLKVTNWCNAPCQLWCHERSHRNGAEADPKQVLSLFQGLPPGIEVALGGGATQTWSPLIKVTEVLKDAGLVPNITVNHFHLSTIDFKLLRNFYGVGVSYLSSLSITRIEELYASHPHVVIHLIMGVHSPDDLKFIAEHIPSAKFLLLGYKHFGNGIQNYERPGTARMVDSKLKDWYIHVRDLMETHHLSFDNLAINQLELSRLFTQEGWSKFYMGDEGRFTMYVDAVNWEYATHSTASKRYMIDSNQTLIDLFSNLQKGK